MILPLSNTSRCTCLRCEPQHYTARAPAIAQAVEDYDESAAELAKLIDAQQAEIERLKAQVHHLQQLVERAIERRP